MAPHSSTLAWKIPWTEEPGGLQSMGSLRVRHDWVTSLSLFTFLHWRGKCNPLPCSCLENPRDGGAWWAAVYGVAQSWTRLKWLSSSRVYLVYLFEYEFQHKCQVFAILQYLMLLNFLPFLILIFPLPPSLLLTYTKAQFNNSSLITSLKRRQCDAV